MDMSIAGMNVSQGEGICVEKACFWATLSVLCLKLEFRVGKPPLSHTVTTVIIIIIIIIISVV
jgi:hypothetical protein